MVFQIKTNDITQKTLSPTLIRNKFPRNYKHKNIMIVTMQKMAFQINTTDITQKLCSPTLIRNTFP